MKPLFALASACALLVATPVFACSEAEAEKMGKEVATKVASITQKNPQRARELNEQLRQRQEARSEQNRYERLRCLRADAQGTGSGKRRRAAQHFAVIRRFGVRRPGTAGSDARDGRATHPA